MAAHLPWSQACENNKASILAVLQRHFSGARRVLEIGSGTGQHAVHFARGLPHLEWLTSDRECNHAAIRAWLAHAPAPNLHPPLALDVTHARWPTLEVDAVFSANTAHIMPWDAVCAMFRGVSALLGEGDPFALYGPFSYGGQHTSPGNEAFDASLRAAGEGMGIRDMDEIEVLGAELGMVLEHDHAMPANNRTVIFRRS